MAAVYARPALYDHRMPVKERSGLKKKSLWLEVAHVMGGKNQNSVYYIHSKMSVQIMKYTMFEMYNSLTA